ncbi:dienelactone hydrolase family protein [Thiohalomonas denitrificans]|uniref:Carboxymethylenebutenolidase n=1 Tax=Thiohalomonas denitrificans TaxID=415747 RepID=A0A1G5QKC5_9GAMM|nr:dienelactone hydrolase family protein [Thiohalomonas denitrificans]SCZ62305.1 carboxymethylenebutenolidase [Thiohalomonas denitrificans]
MHLFRLLAPLALFLATVPVQAQPPEEAGWWDNDWWFEGVLPAPQTLAVRTEWVEVSGEDVDIPALVARPDDGKRYPAVLFQHGRRGLDELIQLHVKRLAARGFVVLAPDIYSARFVEKFPIEHDYALEQDVGVALDALLERTDISSSRACLYSHTRGGYYTLKVAVTQQRQERDVACYVSYYPHMQDPNAPEPMQVYRYAPEADELTIPTLIFIGEEEQYQRRRGIEMAVQSLQEKGRPARLVVYPGVGRGFDFRPDSVRTFADDLAAKDAIWRATRFMRRHLQ